MAITINGTGSITGLTAGGLPDGSIVAGDLASSLDLTGKTVTLPSGTGGKILQVKTTHYDTTTSVNVTNSSINDFPFSVAITPASTDSKIIVSYNICGECNYHGNWSTHYLLNRKIGSTNNYIKPAAAGDRQLGLTQGHLTFDGNDNNSTPEHVQLINYVDSPSTTSEITYIPCFTHESAQNYYINRTVGDGDNFAYGRFRSWITVMEVAD